MFFKKKKRIICPFPVVLDVIREEVEKGADDAILIFDFNGESHMVAMFKTDPHKCEFPHVFAFDETQNIDTFEGLKAERLNGVPLGELQDEVGVIDSDGGGKENRKFPWYAAFERYVCER